MKRLTRFAATLVLLLAAALPVAAAPVSADELANAQQLRTAVQSHGGDSAWFQSYLEALLGANFKRRALALSRGLSEVATAATDSDLEKVLAKRGGADFDALLSVAANEAGSFNPGTPLSEAGLAAVAKVVPPDGEGARPFRVESFEPPAQYRQWLYDEQKVNDKTNNRSVFASLAQNDVPTELDPKQGNVFWLPMVEIPLADASIVQAPGDPATTQQVIVTHPDGEKFVRFFMHPSAEDYYAPLIKKYGVERRFLATPTSSPRSLFVWDPYDQSAKPFVAKTSLPLKVGEVRRVVPQDKIVRGVANSAAISDASDLGQLGNNTLVMKEELGVMPPGFSNGMIIRDIPDAVGQNEWMPGFALTGHDGNQKDSRLVEMIKKSGMDPNDFVNEKIMKPYLAAYADLAFGQGLVGEPHQQNVLFEIGQDGMPTGRVMFRDLDSYKPDVELRARLGLTMEPYTSPIRPTKMFKTAKGSDYYNDSYDTYVKEDIGYMISRDLLKAFPGKFSKKKLYSDMDAMVADLEKARFGIETSPEDLKNFDVSTVVKEWKDRNAAPAPVPGPAGSPDLANEAAAAVPQPILKSEFERGVFNYRVMWTDSKLAKTTDGTNTYVLHDGTIEMQVNGKTAGFVFLEPRDAGPDYYAGVPYPRQAPPEGRLEQLYAPFGRDGSAALDSTLARLQPDTPTDEGTPAEQPAADGQPAPDDVMSAIRARSAEESRASDTIGVKGVLEDRLNERDHPETER
jgi:hypothetical protein